MALEYLYEGKLVILADLPGLDPEHDIAISIAHDVLHIRAHEHLGVQGADHISDLRDGVYERYIALPEGTTEDQIRASYKAGQLELRAPVGSQVKVEFAVIPVAHD